MNEPYFFSASQISTYELCARKWAWRYVDGIETPANKWAAFGLGTHANLEGWFKERKPPAATAEGKVAQVILQHLPPPQAVAVENVEVAFEMSLAGVFFRGFIDLFTPDTTPPKVYDHKTTSDFEWALTPERMLEDVQATLYAAWALVKTQSTQVGLQWTYGLTRGAPRALPVVQVVTGKMIQDRLSRTLASAREARSILEAGVGAKDVPYDAAGCEAYGGCPYRDKCNLSPEERLESIMSQGTAKDNFLEKMRARKANGAGMATNPPAEPVVVVPQAAPAAPAAPPSASLLERLRAQRTAASGPAVPPPVAVAPVVAPAAGSLMEKLRAQRAAANAAVPAAEPAPAAPAASGPAEVPSVASAVPAPPVEVRRGPGRPRKESMGAPLADQWAMFAAAALKNDTRFAAFMADELLKEYQVRFPS